MMRKGLLLLIAVAIVAGCSEEVTGPNPDVAEPTADASPVAPALVCRAQIPSDVVLTGTDFSPIPIDVPDDPRTALPSVALLQSGQLDGTAIEPALTLTYSGELREGEHNAELLSWQSQEQMTFRINQELTLVDGTLGPLPVGLFDLSVTNPNTNEITSHGTLAVVDRPFIDENGLVPGIVCLAQGERTITVNGSMALRHGDETPIVAIGDADFEVAAADLATCTSIAHPSFDAEVCDAFDLTLAQDSVPVGFDGNGVVVNNPDTTTSPEPAGCISEEDRRLRVVPPPTIVAVLEVGEDASAFAAGTGTAVCNGESSRDVVLSGSDFLIIDGAEPIVTMVDSQGTTASLAVVATGDCETLETQGHDVQRCATVTVTIPQEDLSEPYAPAITVANPDPAGCETSTTTLLTLVPPPTITEVVPPLICIEDGDRDVTVLGEGFVVVDGVVPEVTLDMTSIDPTLVTAANCVDLGVPSRVIERCGELQVTISQGLLPEGEPTITVANPQPVGCSDTQDGLLTIVPGPELLAAEPALVCVDDGARTVTITGSGFITVGGTSPTVTMDGVDVTVTSVTGCMPLTVNNLMAESCTTIDVTLAQGSLMEGDTVVVVTNPAPAGCTATNGDILTVPPTITLASATPPTICSTMVGGLVDVTVSGTGFLQIDGVPFDVTVAGNPATPTNISDCTPLTVDGMTVESCDTFTVSIDTTAHPLGGVEIAVANPAPSGCGASSSTIFELVAPPSITTVMPTNICADQTETITVTGSGFAQNSTVLVGTTPADMVVVSADGTTATATFTTGLMPGDYDVTVDNGGGCSGTSVLALTVDPRPLVFFVDPPVVFNGINTDVTIFTTGLSATAGAVELIDGNGTRIPITNFNSPIRPNRIIATVPDDDPNNPGTGLAAGTYEVAVTSAIGCESVLNGTVTITDTLTLALDTIDPTFVSPTKPTAVTITAVDAMSGFENTPRVYLNPSNGMGTASALRAVVFESATELTAVVPGADLTAGIQYDLIVVNPSGAVGLLPMAVTVTVDEPPTVEAVSPASLAAGAVSNATIFGRDFDADPSAVLVDLECRDFVSGMAVSSGVVTVDTMLSSSTALVVSVDATTIPIGAVCIVTVTNGDGSAFRYSALSFKNGSSSAATLAPWAESAQLMAEARRGPALAAGRPTFRSRFLYVAGGDDGVDANVKTSVESIGVDAFGQLDALDGWVAQRNTLATAYVGGATTSSPRSFAGVTEIGRFLYLTGGHDGIGATDTVLRAQVLDPLAGPEMIDVDAALGDGTNGLTEGLWIYRVSALFPDSDPSNPGGESLVGEVLNVDLPAVQDNLVLTFNWEQVPGASGYRLYRTPVADGGVDQVELLTETTGETSTTFTDDNTVVTNPAVTPMPTGSIGVWHGVSSLTVPRQAHGTVAVPNPANTNEYFVYALGGFNGAFLDSGEYAVVTIAADGGQTVSSWTTLTGTLATPISEVLSYAVTPQDTTTVVDAVGTDTFIYVGGGFDGGGAANDFNVAEIDASGDVLAFASPGSPNPARAGSACFQAGDFLYMLGGANRSASGGNDSSKDIIDTSGNFSGGNWNSLGGGALPNTAPRIYPGYTQESAFFYIAGGASSGTAGGVTDTILLTIQ